MSDTVWQPIRDALDRVANAGQSVDFWVRDDDAVQPNAALGRLVSLCESFTIPLLLAVIPAPATNDLAAYVAEHPLLTPAQHGFRHVNHAADGERACELGGLRPATGIFEDLTDGQQKMRHLFGAGSANILVPPWNRIDGTLISQLPSHGFAALSTFGAPGPGVKGLTVVNSDLDIIDWRNGRVGRAHEQLNQRLCTLVETVTGKARPIGLLTHHAAHDRAAWDFMERCMACLRQHPAARFPAIAKIFATAGALEAGCQQHEA